MRMRCQKWLQGTCIPLLQVRQPRSWEVAYLRPPRWWAAELDETQATGIQAHIPNHCTELLPAFGEAQGRGRARNIYLGKSYLWMLLICLPKEPQFIKLFWPLGETSHWGELHLTFCHKDGKGWLFLIDPKGIYHCLLSVWKIQSLFLTTWKHTYFREKNDLVEMFTFLYPKPNLNIILR
jgi:hypothetical protein